MNGTVQGSGPTGAGHGSGPVPQGREEAFCTVGQFRDLGKGYDKHCGPTAITNLVLTLGGVPSGRSSDPKVRTAALQQTFLTIAGTASRWLVYWNTDFLGRIGGTSDVLVRPVLHVCLRKFGIRGYAVHGPFPMTERKMKAEIRKGSILYLMLHANKKYGNHHLLCYGTEEQEGKSVFRVADGWTARPQRLGPEELRYGFFYSVRPLS
ncbi:MAG: hypothetical protein IJG52_07730 [Lachnospiraceae bacterium]|nr:hypothetical protein [Lachnospiraceae bacterium]